MTCQCYAGPVDLADLAGLGDLFLNFSITDLTSAPSTRRPEDMQQKYYHAIDLEDIAEGPKVL